MTDSRSPGKMTLMRGDEDYWQWEAVEDSPGKLVQYVPDGRGGYETSGVEVELNSFSSDFPNQIDINWRIDDEGTTETTRMEMNSDTGGRGGIDRIS